MFVDREKELELLEKNYNNASSTLNIIFGTKSSGKTSLLMEYTKDKQMLYFSNHEMIPSLFFTQMANTISDYFYGTNTIGKPFDTFLDVLEFLNKQKIDKRLVVIFDDFQNILKVDKDALDQLIKFWKSKLKNKNLQIILASSTLFRSANQNLEKYATIIKLDFLTFLSIKKFFPKIKKIDQLYIYSLLGTTPSNLKYYNSNLEFTENIYNIFLSSNSYLFDYGIRVLKTDIVDIGTYSSILYSIAKGNKKVGDIASFLDVKSTYLSRYLQKLIDMMIIEKIVPIDEDKKNSKMGRYTICDNALKFWFLYIYPNLSSLQLNRVKKVSQDIQDDFIRKTVFSTYKKCIKEYISTRYESIFGYKPINVGSWWDNTTSIDLVAYDRKTITFVQILWEDKDIAQIEYGKLKSASEKFQTPLRKKYIIVTKNTFFNIK